MVPIDHVSQLHSLGDGLVRVPRQSRVDFNRDSTIIALGGIIHRCQHVTCGPNVIGGQRCDSCLGVGSGCCQFDQLLSVGVSAGECFGKNCGVGGDPGDGLGVNQVLQVSGVDAVPRQIIQP